MAKYSVFLNISWSVSRGQDTYGYNIARLDDRNTGKRYRTCGGGYDMLGTVFGQWLADVFQEQLHAHVITLSLEDCGYQVAGYLKNKELYGLTLTPKNTVQLDGACGLSSMVRIAEAIGLEVSYNHDKRGRTIGFFVSSK